MPQLVEAGMVYAAVPPLYGLKGKNHTVKRYFTERIDYVKFLMENFSKENTIADANNKTIKPKDIATIIYNNEDYTYEMDKMCRRYALNPVLLEKVMLDLVECNGKDPYKKLKKTIESEWRFMKVNKVNGLIVIDGIINKVSNEILLTDRFLMDIAPMMDKIRDNFHMEFTLNGNKAGLYEVMSKYEKSSPGGLIRYKGLGEMNEDQLAESTLRPDSNRVLIRYVLEDCVAAIKEIEEIESNKKKLLVGSKAKRIDLIG